MNVKQILCPIDFSDSSPAVNEYASTLARALDAHLIYLHVCFPEVPYGSAHVYVDVVQEGERLQKQLEKIKPTVDGVEVSYVVEYGPPTERILEYATENDVDLIVMGTHGRTGLRRVLMGSVAEAVVRKSSCPVMALKAAALIPVD